MYIPRFFKACHLCFSVAVATFGLSTPAEAQIGNTAIKYDIKHTTRTPTIDGVLSGGEWADALHIELDNETEPGQNTPARFKTDVYVMEDGENFLVAFEAQDPDPTKLRAFFRDHDKGMADDRVGVVIDTFNDGRRAYEFWSNALGSKIDQTFDEVARNQDRSWNAIWDSGAQITESGYTVEMKIPLRALRFPSGLPVQTWGLNFARIHQRDVWQRMTDMRKDFNLSCNICQFPKGQGFANLQQQETNVQLIPTVTAGKAERRSNPAKDQWTSDPTDYQAGLDLRWAVSEGTILNATVNPDFSQVEADQAQLDVNRTFALFFQERREFFLDGADYFNIASVNQGFTANLNPLYTRNISDPDYGIKLTGKEGSHTYAVLAAHDARTGFTIPGAQGSSVASLADTESEDLAGRYRFDLGRAFSIGALGTARQADNYSNTMLATDMSWQMGKSDRLNAVFMHSSSDYPDYVQRTYHQKATLSDNAWKMLYSHSDSFWYWNASEARYGEDFRADLGFTNRVGIREHMIQPGFQWRRGPKYAIHTIGMMTNWSKMDDEHGHTLQNDKRASIFINGPWQLYAELFGGTGKRYYNGRDFDTRSISLWSEVNPWNGIAFNMELSKERTVDFANTQSGDATTLRPGFNIQLSRHMQVQLSYTMQTMDVAGGELYSTNLADLRLTYQFSNNSFVRVVIIDSSTDRNPALYTFAIDPHSRNFSTQFLYSYRLNAQSRFFVGYSDAALENATVPELERTYKTVFAKFSYAWQY